MSDSIHPHWNSTSSSEEDVPPLPKLQQEESSQEQPPKEGVRIAVRSHPLTSIINVLLASVGVIFFLFFFL